MPPVIDAFRATLEHIKDKVGELLNGQTDILGRVHIVKGNTATLLSNDERVFQLFRNLNVTINSVLQSSTSLEGDGDQLLQGQAQLLANQAGLSQGQQTLLNGQTTIQNGLAVLQEGQANLKAGQAVINTNLGKLEAGQGRIENSLDVLQTGQQDLQTSVDAVDSTLNNVQSVQNGLVKSVQGLLNDAVAKNQTLSKVVDNQGGLIIKQGTILGNTVDIKHALEHLKDKVAKGFSCQCPRSFNKWGF